MTAAADPARGAKGAAITAVGLSKSFGPVQAVVAADFSADFGEVHALVGENGAGKSTLIKMLCGVLRPDSGQILIRNEQASLAGPANARRYGIGTVFQELTLLPWLTVAENLLINEPVRGALGLIRRRAQPQVAAEVLGQYEITELDPRELAANLSVAERQVIEIVRTIHRGPDILFLDEPTASLSEHEVRWLFTLVKGLRDRGKCVIFTSHRWREVEHLADRITVFRNGSHVATRRTLDQDEAVMLMTGRTLDRAYPRPAPVPHRDPALEVSRLRGERLNDVSLRVSPGEILGVGGLAGQGQRDLFLTIFGAKRATAGEVRVHGRLRHIRRPADAIRAGLGIALIPEDRKSEGLLLPMSVRDNLSLAILPRVARAGVVRRGLERRIIRDIVRRLGIRTTAPNRTPVGSLSGGNQQKVLIGRWLLSEASILLLYDVTRGVDVATKHEIYDLMVRLAGEGKAIIFYSSETEEVARLSHRIIVLREGRVVAELTEPEIDAEAVVAAALREAG